MYTYTNVHICMYAYACMNIHVYEIVYGTAGSSSNTGTAQVPKCPF